MLPYLKQTKLVAFLLLLFGLIISGCAPQVSLNTIQPAQLNTDGIRKVAIGNFEIASITMKHYIAETNRWKILPVRLLPQEQKVISRLVRSKVVNMLASTPYFQLVYLDDFEKLRSDRDVQQAIAAAGVKTDSIDAVVSGKLWLDLTRYQGNQPEKVDLEYALGGRTSMSAVLQTVAFFPYKSIRGTLGLELKMTRVSPTEIIAVTFDERSFSQKAGGSPQSLQEDIANLSQKLGSFFAKDELKKTSGMIEDSEEAIPQNIQIISDMAESIAASFVKRVAISRKTQSYPIATGGNESAEMLIKAGAFETAIQTLNTALEKQSPKNPDDLYNLGLAYEAAGDYGIAYITYEEALRYDPTNLMYAQGLGRTDRLKKQYRKVNTQLNKK